MVIHTAVARLSALSHPTRLAVLKHLVASVPDGAPAGQVAAVVGVAPSNLTAHLNILVQAGLVRSETAGRNKIYSVEVVAMADLLAFLVEDCCHGHPEICAGLEAPGRDAQSDARST